MGKGSWYTVNEVVLWGCVRCVCVGVVTDICFQGQSRSFSQGLAQSRPQSDRVESQRVNIF